ncbi:hypothetical protein [Paracoccus binzhouensis]|nr:hypothetical protein [Paracoccus binzhouensis]
MYCFAHDPGFIAFLPQEDETPPDREDSRLGQALAIFWTLAFLGMMVL